MEFSGGWWPPPVGLEAAVGERLDFGRGESFFFFFPACLDDLSKKKNKNQKSSSSPLLLLLTSAPPLRSPAGAGAWSCPWTSGSAKTPTLFLFWFVKLWWEEKKKRSRGFSRSKKNRRELDGAFFFLLCSLF